MSEIHDKFTLQFICPKCKKKFGKFPSRLKPGGAVSCPKCGETFVDEPVLKAAQAFEARCKSFGI